MRLSARHTFACAAIALLLAPALSAWSQAAADNDVLRLPIGDPARSGNTLRPVLDGVVDTRTGDVITPAELARRLAGTRILFVGEEHTNIDYHRVQAAVIRALHEARRHVVVGLEMFPWDVQPALDRFSRGRMSDRQFIDQAGWYDNWGYRYGYYADIFAYAREHRLPLQAINAPREIIKTIRQSGFDAVPAEARRHLPPTVDTSSPEHRRLFRAYMGGAAAHGGLSEAQFEAMFRAQCSWDAVMGWGAVQALERQGRRNTIVVALMGSGHVTYGLGAARQIAERLPDGVATLMPVPVADARGEVLRAVQASYADYLWGVPIPRAPRWPDLGVSLAGPPAPAVNEIIQVDPGGAAAGAGVRKGDLLTRLGDHTIRRNGDLRRAMADYQWGDGTQLEVMRDGERLRLNVIFRREGPAG